MKEQTNLPVTLFAANDTSYPTLYFVLESNSRGRLLGTPEISHR